VQSEKNAGGKGVARANHANYSRLGDAKTALIPHPPVSAQRAGPLWKMNHHPFLHPSRDQQLSSFSEGDEIDALFFAHHNACGTLNFKFVEEAIINIGQRRHHNFFKTVAILADQVNAGLEARSFRALQDSGSTVPWVASGRSRRSSSRRYPR